METHELDNAGFPDSAIMTAARAALAESAPPAMTPPLAEAIRREAARRRLAKRIRLVLSSVSSAAAALAVVALVAFPPRARNEGRHQADEAREALRMFLCDAAEAADASVSPDDSAAVDWDCADFDFADALLAWQEAPMAL